MDQANTSRAEGTDQSGIVATVREKANAQLAAQKNRATDGLGSVAHAVRQTGQQLRDQQNETVANYVERAADQLERFSARLKDKDINELLNDAQHLARRQPALFVGSAFAVGLLGARFLKSSSTHRSDVAMGRRSGEGVSGVYPGSYTLRGSSSGTVSAGGYGAATTDRTDTDLTAGGRTAGERL